MKLRHYQQKAITEARESFKRGNKDICLCLCTGAGKSIIARKIVEAFREKNPNGKIGYYTFRTILTNQMKETLKGLDVEIATLQKKGKNETDNMDLIIVDEVHYARDSKLQNNLNSKFKIGLTATPITPQGYALEFDEIIDIVQLADLIKWGYASPVKVLSVSKVDTSSLKTVAGDFSQKDSFELMSKSQIKKDIAETYLKYAKGLKTIVYCVNIKHCEDLEKEFKQLGINCASIHSKKKDTQKSLELFKDNKIDVLINCDVLTTGFDAPDIYCLILASPTKSLIKATQIYGRATRLNPADKNKEALIIDCAEVIKNTQHPLQRFDFTKTKKEKYTKCPSCKEKMKLVNRQVNDLSEFEYSIVSDYICECGEKLRQENIKIINKEICEGCGDIFKSVGGLSIDKNDKSMKFDLVCECGHKKPFREIVFTDDELKEIQLEEAQKGATWEDVRIILKAECKNAGYKWQYADRLIDKFKNENYHSKDTIEKIKQVKKMGRKISSLMYI